MDRRIAHAIRALIGRKRTTPRIRRWPALTSTLVAVAVGGSFLASSPGSSRAGLNPERPGIVDPGLSLAPAAPRQPARVQPRAVEFAAPYGKPDLSPESGRAVDRLYDELMSGTPPKCLRAAIRGPGEDRC